VVASGQEAINSAELRRYVGERLPEYMVPAVIVELAELPLLSNGKLNRRALPATDETGLSVKRSYAPPRTPVERQLVEMWKELLGVETVGIDDHFFELGGHSLMLTQLASRIRKEFRVNIPLRVLFDAPTVIAMGDAILAGQMDQVDQRKVDEMLQRLKQLSPEQMKALLAESQAN
jgi:acyl carrier protein